MEARKPVFGKSNSVEDMQHVRLMALLQELEREHGRKGAAAVLGLDHRTPGASLDEGVLSRRVRGALERALQEGIGSAADRQRERNDGLEKRLKGLHGVLFQPTKAERVMPAEVKVLGWRKGERSGMVVHGAGRPGRRGKFGGPAVRVGGHVPWGAKAEYAYRAGYDGTGRVSVTHVVERGYSAMLKQPEMAAA